MNGTEVGCDNEKTLGAMSLFLTSVNVPHNLDERDGKTQLSRVVHWPWQRFCWRILLSNRVRMCKEGWR